MRQPPAPPQKKKSRGIQAVLAGAGAVGAIVGSVSMGTEGKTRLVLAAVSSVLAAVAAFSHPPVQAEQ